MSWLKSIFGGSRKDESAARQEALAARLPLVEAWIDRTIADHASEARPVSDFNFPRLSQYYSPEVLSRMKVVVVDKVPVPPLSKLGLRGFEDFEKMEAAGITYKDTFFVKASEVNRESLHFHELVHTLQWEELGAGPFLLAYAAGLAEKGYRESPLEVMAYDLTDRFNRHEPAFSVEESVRQQIEPLRQQFTAAGTGRPR